MVKNNITIDEDELIAREFGFEPDSYYTAKENMWKENKMNKQVCLGAAGSMGI